MNPTTETTHNGKIGRLPRNLRDELNLRLENSESSGAILSWLNALPETQAVLASKFGGSQISEQNLTNWRQGAYQIWLKHRERRNTISELTQDAAELATHANGGELASHLSTVLVAELAASAHEALSAITDPAEQCAQLRDLLHTLARVRRQDCQAGRLAIDQELRARDRVKEKEDAGYREQWNREFELMKPLLKRADMADLYAQPDITSQALAGAHAESLLREAKPDGPLPNGSRTPANSGSN
jgi:hypothetical protein